MAFLFEYFRDEYGKKPCDDDTTVIFQLFTGKIHQVHFKPKTYQWDKPYEPRTSKQLAACKGKSAVNWFALGIYGSS